MVVLARQHGKISQTDEADAVLTLRCRGRCNKGAEGLRRCSHDVVVFFRHGTLVFGYKKLISRSLKSVCL